MSEVEYRFKRSERSLFAFLVLTVVGSVVSLFLVYKANKTIDEIDKLLETPYYEGLRHFTEDDIGDAAREQKRYTGKDPGFSILYPSSWIVREQLEGVSFRDPDLRKQGYLNDIASIKIVTNVTQLEAIQKAFFVEENGLYFAIGRRGEKSETPAVEDIVGSKKVLVGSTVIAVYTEGGNTSVGLAENYRALVSEGNRHAIIDVLANKDLLYQLIKSFSF